MVVVVEGIIPLSVENGRLGELSVETRPDESAEPRWYVGGRRRG